MTNLNNEQTIPECSTCNDTGYTCENCLHADGECECNDGPVLIPCESCDEDEDDDE